MSEQTRLIRLHNDWFRQRLIENGAPTYITADQTSKHAGFQSSESAFLAGHDVPDPAPAAVTSLLRRILDESRINDDAMPMWWFEQGYDERLTQALAAGIDEDKPREYLTTGHAVCPECRTPCDHLRSHEPHLYCWRCGANMGQVVAESAELPLGKVDTFRLRRMLRGCEAKGYRGWASTLERVIACLPEKVEASQGVCDICGHPVEEHVLTEDGNQIRLDGVCQLAIEPY